MCLVTIVVPIYNGEAYIRKCVKYIQEQTYKNLEVMLVNDGSTDNSGAVCKEAIGKDPRFSLIDRENGGTARARNTGLDHATGKYIIFLDVDDEYSPVMIEKMVGVIERQKTDMVVCGFRFKVEASEEEGKDYYKDRVWATSVYHNQKEMRKDYISIWDSDMFSTVWNKLFRMETIRRYGMRFRDGHVYTEDRVFNRLFLSKTQSVAFIGECLYNFVREHAGSTTERYRETLFDIRDKEYNEFKQHFRELGVWDEESREYTSREFIERIAGCIEHVFHAGSQLTIHEKYQKIRNMITHPDVREAIKYAECRSVKMKIFALPIRMKWTFGAYLIGGMVYSIRKRNPIFFHRMKDRR